LALDSIVRQSYKSLEVIVVDNLSDKSEETAQVARSYSGVKLIQNRRNLGYTGGMNKGIAAASGKYIHFTVDDVVFDEHCIRSLVEHAEREPAAGLLSGILYDEAGLIICAGGKFELAPIYVQTSFGAGEKDVGQFPQAFPVRYIPGGMIFTRTDFIKRLEGFRDDFFIYSEDSELCARVSQLGREIVVVPQAKAVVHEVPHAFTPEGIAFHKLKNIFTLYLLHARLAVLPEFLLRYGIISFPKYLLTNRGYVWPLLKAWAWFLYNAPFLITERMRNRRLATSWPRSS
jgi:GT2 family glycosyltransferase